MVGGKQKTIQIVLMHIVLILFIVVIFFPFLMVVSISFREGNFALGGIIPEKPSLEHWRYVLSPSNFVLRWLWNSVMIASIASALIVILSTTAAYAFARLHFAFKGKLLSSLLILQMFPMVVALVAIYAILDFIGSNFPALHTGINTHSGVIIAYLGGIATYIWMIKGYFDTIPGSMEESAMMDGASPFQTFTLILLPMSYPALAVTFILSFIAAIGEYPVASVVLQSTERWTLAVGANSFLYEQNYLWGAFAATAVLSGLPITIAFLLTQRLLVSGLTSGGAKE